MADKGDIAPVVVNIIKRKKIIAGGGHHGGAWKVAYADFVTAMMAFFMLMWLMNATTEKQRKGLADYFAPSVTVSRVSGGGSGLFGGDSMFAEHTLAKNGTGGRKVAPRGKNRARGHTGVATDSVEQQREAMVKQALDKKLLGNSGDSNLADELKKHIRSRVTDEGLVIELFDLPGRPLFPPRSTTPTRLMRRLVSMISDVFRITPNKIAVSGFVRSYPIVLRKNPGWDLSSARAQRVRKMLLAAGTAKARIARVTSWADHRPEVKNPMAVRNNRIEITLLRSDRAATGK